MDKNDNWAHSDALGGTEFAGDCHRACVGVSGQELAVGEGERLDRSDLDAGRKVFVPVIGSCGEGEGNEENEQSVNDPRLILRTLCLTILAM
jgi:hypothetical protein